MRYRRILQKLWHFKNILTGKCFYSYAQAGEDLIVNYLFRSIGIDKPTYLEIGSNHPFIANNTYLFYSRGLSGVCVEPDPDLIPDLKKYRKKDIIVNAGIGLENGEAEFFCFPHPYTSWSTFSKAEAAEREKESAVKVKEVKRIKLQTINDVIHQNFISSPDFLSIDVEGMDLAILQSLDFTKYRPRVICAETISFSLSNKEEKINDLIEFVKGKDYFVYADTHINTIFCRKDIFNSEK